MLLLLRQSSPSSSRSPSSSCRRHRRRHVVLIMSSCLPSPGLQTLSFRHRRPLSWKDPDALELFEPDLRLPSESSSTNPAVRQSLLRFLLRVPWFTAPSSIVESRLGRPDAETASASTLVGRCPRRRRRRRRLRRRRRFGGQPRFDPATVAGHLPQSTHRQPAGVLVSSSTIPTRGTRAGAGVN